MTAGREGMALREERIAGHIIYVLRKGGLRRT